MVLPSLRTNTMVVLTNSGIYGAKEMKRGFLYSLEILNEIMGR